MRFAHRTAQRFAAAAMASGVLAGGTLALATAANATPAKPTTIHLHLHAMPAGTVTLGRDGENDITATVNAFGLTPGSSHTVELVSRARVITRFSTLTANSVGRADATLDSTFKGALAHGSRLEILNGTASDSVSTEPIAKSSRLCHGISTYRLISVEVGSHGTSYGTPHGSATFVYNPSAQTITVTVNASGLTPGAHAAHIHDGSCMSQGPVQYMLMDFTANSHGRIVNQTRTVTGVTAGVPASGWYLNLHQGNSNNILANGQPTINFRPLLCANI